jgi:hypothetical protein
VADSTCRLRRLHPVGDAVRVAIGVDRAGAPGVRGGVKPSGGGHVRKGQDRAGWAAAAWTGHVGWLTGRVLSSNGAAPLRTSL